MKHGDVFEYNGLRFVVSNPETETPTAILYAKEFVRTNEPYLTPGMKDDYCFYIPELLEHSSFKSLSE